MLSGFVSLYYLSTIYYQTYFEFPFQDHACILHSIVGWDSTIGEYSRVEGTPHDPNPNKPFAKLEVVDLFNSDGRLNPSITVIGKFVHTAS